MVSNNHRQYSPDMTAEINVFSVFAESMSANETDVGLIIDVKNVGKKIKKR